MSKPLRRPMFRMGGSPNTNSGIVSGFAQPRRNFDAGTREEDDAMFDDTAAANQGIGAGTTTDILGTGTGTDLSSEFNVTDNIDLVKAQKAAEEQFNPGNKSSGLSASDWLRVAAAGGEILGAENRGSGLMGALATAGPALSNLGTSLATSADTREASYQKRLDAYNQVKLTGAQSDLASSREFQQGKALLKLKAELDPYKFANQYDVAEARKIRKAMSTLDPNSQEYKDYRQELLFTIYGDITKVNIEAKADLLQDKEFLEKVTSKASTMIQEARQIAEANKKAGVANTPQNNPYWMPGVDGAPGAPYPQDVLEKMIQKETFEEVLIDIAYPPGVVPDDGNALGGTPNDRTKFANGSTMTTNTGPYEPGSGPNPDPGSPPVMQFEELRARLPQEVSDSVIKLIMQSEQAMVDFAQIQTPQDIQVFNQKYNTDLQTPTQVA